MLATKGDIGFALLIILLMFIANICMIGECVAEINKKLDEVVDWINEGEGEN